MELLVVMGIMTLIILASVPAFHGITRGSAMQSSLTQLRTTIALARQWAITRRQITYVVFPSSSNSIYSTYNVYAITNIVSTNYQGEYVRDWTALPPGVFFETSAGGDNILKGAWASGGNVPPSLPGLTGTAYCIKFTPDGSTTGIGDIYRKPTVYLTEGYLRDDTGAFAYKPNSMTNSLEISSVGGQIKTYQP